MYVLVCVSESLLLLVRSVLVAASCDDDGFRPTLGSLVVAVVIPPVDPSIARVSLSLSLSKDLWDLQVVCWPMATWPY